MWRNLLERGYITLSELLEGLAAAESPASWDQPSFTLVCHQVAHRIYINYWQLVWSAAGDICHFNQSDHPYVLAKNDKTISLVFFFLYCSLLKIERKDRMFLGVGFWWICLFCNLGVRSESSTGTIKSLYTFVLFSLAYRANCTQGRSQLAGFYQLYFTWYWSIKMYQICLETNP